jgi:hypothetical protein
MPKAAAAETEGISVTSVVTQCLLISLIFYLWSSPVIQPVKIMAVLFHEMSHGLMAIVSGGKVLSIAITADEGGACETEGGVGELIVSAGYMGSMFFGGLLLYLSRYRGCVPIVYTLLTMVVTTAIFTVLHDPYSRTFATGLAASFIFFGVLAPSILGALFLRVLGTIGCLYSIFDIYWDVLAVARPDHVVENDAVVFSKLTGMSPQLVGGLWLAVSVVYFLFVMKIIMKQVPVVPAEEEAKPAPAKA